ncbi:hypothetical protein OVA24_15550 [Luteolibacter sp. SL250]|uniref:hypothetical protein n=1 Tax=Luteolibacter sp. SL250 TaxID=2995170 RepID=UPI00226EE90D|nr:hypothetical protein [Luteolibacter sp. SL250]WAC18647.1 hypothetical protein OVA24_15550 [Luteolibacter sp. SL250]
MRRRKIISLTAFALVVLGGMIWCFRPYPEIDQRQAHPSLRYLDDSATCAWTSFGDGGSMAIEVHRPNKTVVTLCLSNGLDQPFGDRGQLYVGASHHTLPGAARITGFAHTKYVVANLLARDLPGHSYLREPIALLTGRIPDWIMFFMEDPSHASTLLRSAF